MKTNSLDFDAQALREKILDLAMRGKLVKQDPNDEPASVLLEKIKAEKEQLIKEKKIKKSKLLPPISDEEKPFEIPDSWEWVRLGDIGAWAAGATPSRKHPEYYGGTIPWLKTGDLNDGIVNETSEKITELGVKNSSVKVNEPGNVLIAMYGATIGKLGIVGNQELVTNQACCGCSLFDGVHNWYLFYYLLASRKRLIDLGSGGAQPNISKNKIEKFTFPLPPLEEQSRIAAKIAQLFALLRKVESSTQQYAKLQTLLKSKVLDLAMRGKLIKQDPNDEPASVLLEKIKAEKAELVKEKKIKKSKPLPEITDDEKPFDIPDSWEWGRLGDICLSNIGLTYKPSQKSEKPTKTIILRANNVEANELNKENVIFLDIDNLKEKYYLKENDILMAVRSGSKRLVGKSAVVTPQFVGFSFGAFMSKIRILSANSWYVDYFLNSAAFRSQLGDANTTTINQITQGMINNFVLPLPPLSEQNRIAAKIAQLFALLRKDESSN